MRKKLSETAEKSAQKTEMENLQEDILFLLKESVELAKENPNSNTLYAVLRGLSAAKLSAEIKTHGEKRKNDIPRVDRFYRKRDTRNKVIHS